ncbi:hypothetical protein PRIPAC_80987 [Pristionchus pacificus]|uniref:Uncharacterized protein n=1 Tax=Pristionchus pacificus TaxID=54126 RepID=A0A2A6CLM9_PRIPA|nr:hypothetical protein PRIPAC_80987 [Pristionchus pacificus]|eukprot:PDM79114.1 hypothetical protein PRIPAC_31693 [Pristionchus pacificus]
MVHSADPSPVKVPRGPSEHSTPPIVPLETKFVNFAPRKTTRKMSQFESSYKRLLASISSLSPLVTSIENDISQIFEASNSDEIQKISARVARILVDAQIIRDDYSDLFSSLTQAIDSMDDNDSSKEVEQKKLQDFRSSTEATSSMEINPVSVSNVVSKLENKFRRSHETATGRASALSRLTPPISVPSDGVSQSLPLLSTPVDGDSTSTSQLHQPSTAHIEYQTLAAKIVDLEARLSNRNAQPSPHSNIVLPPITLQTFDGGDITKWPAYKYQLDMLILNQPQYNEVEKICYVQSTLRGTALSLISTIPTNKDFLAKIIARLETEYSRPNLTQATLLQSLLKVQSKSNKLEDQLDTVRIMINLVHSISDDCGLDGLVMQQQIADRIHPRFIPVIWRRRSTTLLESLELIEETLRTELEDVTMINAISDRNHHQKSVVVNNYSGSLSMPRSSVTNSSPPSPKAPRGPNEHNSADCSKKCAKCSGEHHRSICDKPSNTAVNVVSMQQPERLFTTTATVADPPSNRSISVNTQTSYTHRSERLFTVDTQIANPDPAVDNSVTASILLDHGAQANLITRDLADRLALVPFDQRELTISGFNDEPVQSSTYDIVKLDVPIFSASFFLSPFVLSFDKNEATQTRIKLPAVFRAPIRSDVVCFMHDQVSKNKRQSYAVTRLLLNHGEPVGPSLVFLVFAEAERTAQDREHSVACVSIARRMWPGVLGVAEIPFVVSDKVESFRKTKEAVSFLHRANLWDDVEKVYNSKKIRAGISRNRRFKQKLGPTIVYGKDSGVKQELFCMYGICI